MLLTNEGKDAMLQGIADRLNTGINAAIAIYIGETLTAEIALKNPVEASISAGVMIFNKPFDALVTVSGVPTAAKLIDTDGVVIADLDAATEITLDKDKVYAGGFVGVASLTLGI